MNTEMVKGKPLSKDETKALLKLIENSKIITTKSIKATSNRLKTEEWKRLTQRFNATAVYRRTPQQLRLKWENLKKSSRKRSIKIRMNRTQTGGAGDYIRPDEILDRVSRILGSTVRGIKVPFGGDKEPEEIVVDGDECENDQCGGDENEISGEVTDGEATVDVGKNLNSDGPDTDEVVSQSDEEQMATESPTSAKRLSFSTGRNVKRRKIVMSTSRTDLNIAIAEYFKAKKECLDAELSNTLLQNEKIKMENDKLKLEIEKIKAQEKINLENENLKLKIEKLKDQENIKMENEKLKLEIEKLKDQEKIKLENEKLKLEIEKLKDQEKIKFENEKLKLEIEKLKYQTK